MGKFQRTELIDFDDINETITIKKPTDNMQDDSAAFEAWSMLLKVTGEYKSVTLKFNSLNNPTIFEFNNLDTNQQYYVRFLYRLFKFKEAMNSWFNIHKDNISEVDQFKRLFNDAKKINHIPDSHSTFSKNPKKEHILEKSFLHNLFGDEIRVEHGLEDQTYCDQLPVGIFCDKVKDKSRIFNKGAIDLWSIDSHNKLCIYELKEPNNQGAGIVSELFFYANLMSDLISGNNNWQLNPKKSSYRGYGSLQTLKTKEINAFFLVKNLHSSLEKFKVDILKLLNSSDKIKYEILYYDVSENWENELIHKLSEIYN
ncbi:MULTISPECIES: hypothetical protein [unclassified Oceanispirochaeta]|uniref:hypothetical protein n=1 Tax=unclassified Oceanispirochaeta TaxID=2635722 RepID=UPI000E095AED|nr:MULTISPECIES: hypothetical protein [unclassified Oceanispirochaeta]MBF9018966.1 hypothetical protein [Oceanispirochaeta sp. M2]NPD75466.1 hypothetical protein [Oceanispirochaeta sp. M1]RDG28676.1 hypothetical protein DV872_25560 [Oceanispirochaeta sp. M1]